MGLSGNVEARQIPWSRFLGLFRLCVDGELDFFQARAVQQDLLVGGGELFEGHFDVELVVFGQAFQHAEVKTVATVPALDGATGQAQRWKRHHAGHIENILVSQAITTRARAHRRVEAEQARKKLRTDPRAPHERCADRPGRARNRDLRVQGGGSTRAR